MRSGQVTVFIIAALIMLITAFFFLSAENFSTAAEKNIRATGENEETQIETYVEECLDLALEEGIRTIFSQGGYYLPVLPFEDFSGIKVPYYLSEYVLRYPSLNEVIENVQKYLDAEVINCDNGFESWEARGYAITPGTPSANVFAVRGMTKATVNFPLRFTRMSESITLSDFSAESPIDVENIHSSVRRIMESQKKDPFRVHLSEVGEIGYADNFTFDLIYLDQTRVLYNLAFRINENVRDVKYNFIANYAWGDEKRTLLPDNETIESLEAYVGKEFSYQVPSEGKESLFSDNSDLFEIESHTGLIRFVPEEKDIGTHYIIVEEKNGQATSGTITEIEVKSAQ